MFTNYKLFAVERYSRAGLRIMFPYFLPNDAYLFAIRIQAQFFFFPSQGFAVTLPYCFLNTEIRNVVKNHWDRYQTTRTVVENINNVTRAGTLRREGGNGVFGANSARNSLSFYNNEGSRRSSTFR